MSSSLLLTVAGIGMLALALLYAGTLARWARAIGPAGSVPAERAQPLRMERPFVSVVIAARNEEARLHRTLQSLLEQDYPGDRYEVVVVDDRSTDRTSEVAGQFAVAHPARIRLLRIDETSAGWAPKMWALQRGIEEASGEFVLTTDADCLPERAWITALTDRLVSLSRPGIVGGPVDYRGAGEWRWPKRLLRTEFLSLSLVAAGSIARGHPVVISSQNLGFSRELFLELGGHQPHRSLRSGDDVFLLFAAMRAGAPVSYLHDPDAVVGTDPPSGPLAFYHQRARWASKGHGYPLRPLALASLVWGLNTLILLGAAGALTGWPGLMPWLGATVATKTGGDLLLLRRGAGLGLRGYATDYLTGLPLYVPYVVLAGLGGMLQLFRWK